MRRYARDSRSPGASHVFERRDQFIGPGPRRVLQRFAQIPQRLAGALALVRDAGQRAQDLGALGTGGARHVERLAENAIRVGQVARGGQRLAELAAEDEDCPHRVVELSAEELAPGELEASVEPERGPRRVPAGQGAFGYALEQEERFEGVLRKESMERAYFGRQPAGLGVSRRRRVQLTTNR